MKIQFLLILLIFFSTKIYTHSLLDGKFDQFLAELVPAEDQKQFRLFYNELKYQQRKRENSVNSKVRNKQQKYVQKLQERGRNGLEVKEPDLTKNLRPYLNNFILDEKTNKKVSTFLFRYGAYEEFLTQKANKQNSMFVKAKSYVRDASSKVVSWLGGFRRSKTI
ncbi:MAG: hypothetical protein WDZ41_05175 [Candidatus Babeliales bacterium]